MQFLQTPQHTQLSLFEAFMAQPLAPYPPVGNSVDWSSDVRFPLEDKRWLRYIESLSSEYSNFLKVP